MGNEQRYIVNVWDRTTRIFHWVNFLSVLTLMILGTIILNGKTLGLSGDAKILLKVLHVSAGYVFAVNLIWRIVWAFVGRVSARWKSILPFGKGYSAELKAFVDGEKSGNALSYAGHNPLAKLIITLLLIVCITQMVTGLVIAGTDIYYPPFGSMIAEWVAASGVDPVTLIPGDKSMLDPAAYKEMRGFRSPYIQTHVYGFYTLLAFTLIHIAAVIVHEAKHSEGIISAMFSGKKLLNAKPADESSVLDSDS